MKKAILTLAELCCIGLLVGCNNGTTDIPIFGDVFLKNADVVNWYNGDSKVSLTFSQCELFNEDVFGTAESFQSSKYVFTYDKLSQVATIKSKEKTYEFKGVVYNQFLSDATAIYLQNSPEEKKTSICVRFVIQPAGKHYTMNVSSQKHKFTVLDPRTGSGVHFPKDRFLEAIFTQK